MAEVITIRLPVPPTVESEGAKAYLFEGSLRGKIVGIRTDTAWRSWTIISEVWMDLLEREGATVDVLVSADAPGVSGAQQVADSDRTREWAERIDLGISGLGNCGSCTAYTVRDGIAIEAAGKPAVIAATSEFEIHAHTVAEHLNHPNLKVLVFPYPLEGRDESELREIAVEYFPKFLNLICATKVEAA